jgi:ribosomal protein L23
MITCYDIIKSLMRTEKGASLESQRKYTFYVAKDATKITIKKAVEEIYKVKVDAVHTLIVEEGYCHLKRRFKNRNDLNSRQGQVKLLRNLWV